jgi:diguanylate cyclase (GGDEF)-like protein
MFGIPKHRRIQAHSPRETVWMPWDVTAEEFADLRQYVLGILHHDTVEGLPARVAEIARTFSATAEYDAYRVRYNSLRTSLKTAYNEAGVQLADEVLPVVRAGILRARRFHGDAYDAALAKVTRPEVAADLQTPVARLDAMIRQPWFSDGPIEVLPHLTDFIPLEFAVFDPTPTTRIYDEKFHILQAPQQLFADLTAARDSCDVRDLAVSLVYVDLDDFKSFNSEHGETTVDRVILPPVMRAMESFAFGRGHAYRFGGDEYVISLINTDADAATTALHKLAKIVSSIPFSIGARPMTMSIGFVALDRRAFLTNREALERAERAKTFAKREGGKNCVATFSGELFTDDELQIAERGT